MARKEVRQLWNECDRCGVVISKSELETSITDSESLEADVYPGIRVVNISGEHSDNEQVVDYPMLCRVCRKVMDRLIGEMRTVTRKKGKGKRGSQQTASEQTSSEQTSEE